MQRDILVVLSCAIARGGARIFSGEGGKVAKIEFFSISEKAENKENFYIFSPKIMLF